MSATVERRPGPARGAPRPRRAPARHRPRRGHRDLGLDRPPVDPTHAHADELVERDPADDQGAARLSAPSMPKELMLFVKNMVFLDGAIATLAPDLDLFAEIGERLDVLRHHPRRAPRRRARASTPSGWQLDLDGREGRLRRRRRGRRALTYRDLQERREIIREPAAEARAAKPRRSCRAPRHRPLLGRLRGPAQRPPADGHPAASW